MSSTQDGLPPRARMEAVLAICATVCLATLDAAIVNTALPTIARDLGSDAATSIWIVNAYQIVLVATLLPLAALGDIVGHRRLYISGVVLFTVTSLACGLAWSLETLVAARALQALGAAAIMSVNSALIRFIHPAKHLGRGVGMNALVVGTSFTIGPTVASAILSVASWHWLFLVNVPIGSLALFLALRSLPVTPRSQRAFDPVAAVLCAGFFSLLILGLAAISHGDGAWLVAAEWLGALACFFALLRREAGLPAPMLAVDLLRIPVFALSAATSVCSFTTQGLAFVALPFLLQDIMGHSQVETGFLMTPWPAVVALMAPIAGRLSDRYPAGLLGTIGLILMSAGMMCLALMPADAGTYDIIWRLLLCGAGFGFFQAPNLRTMMGSVPPARSGGASGLVAAARLTGQGMGAALCALCLTISPANGPVLALWLGSCFAATGIVASVLRLAPWRRKG